MGVRLGVKLRCKAGNQSALECASVRVGGCKIRYRFGASFRRVPAYIPRLVLHGRVGALFSQVALQDWVVPGHRSVREEGECGRTAEGYVVFKVGLG